jgi:hydroxypyruvate reductase
VEALAKSLESGDLLLLLLSGGASALLPAPAGDVTLADKAAVTSLLMRAGATIGELNTVRKHLSRLKGGGLARAASPARVVCLALSDVVGDDLSTIASGPTVPDPTTYADALAVLAGRGVLDGVPAAVRGHLEAGVRGSVPETPKPGDPLFRRVTTRIVGSNRVSVAAASRQARRLGLRPVVLTTRLEGEAREAARVLVAVLRECVETGHPAAPPVCLLAGGETTVTVLGDGHGGRNQELVVSAALPLAGFPGPAVVASLATDGVDGRSDAAGGVADDKTLERASGLGLAPPGVFLASSDSNGFLAPLGDLIVIGPTGTNVVDLTVLLAGKRGGPAGEGRL